MANKDTSNNRSKVIGVTRDISAAQKEQVSDPPAAPDTAAEEKVEATPAATPASRPEANKPRTGIFILFVLVVIGVAAAAWWFSSRAAKAPAGSAADPATGNSAGAPSGCQEWSKISAEDAGKEICAYGVVKTAYTGKGVTYIRFSEEKDSFRFLNSNGKDFSKLVGQCVQAKGVVKTYGKMPYIEIGDKLDPCK